MSSKSERSLASGLGLTREHRARVQDGLLDVGRDENLGGGAFEAGPDFFELDVEGGQNRVESFEKLGQCGQSIRQDLNAESG